uniref:Uncharacterized protein n=1 Tax=Globodera rostochiensis TaxID=31243 RepID=A0A914H4F7_GLORO
MGQLKANSISFFIPRGKKGDGDQLFLGIRACKKYIVSSDRGVKSGEGPTGGTRPFRRGKGAVPSGWISVGAGWREGRSDGGLRGRGKWWEINFAVRDTYAESTSEVGSNSDSVIRADTGQNARCSLLNNSGSATQIGCSSMFSSFYAPQNANADEGEKEQHLDKNLAHFYREAELLASEFAPSDPLGNGLSDEAFVAKHVLAEQIGSIQFSSNPVLHKFCLVPCRHLSVGSYIFSTRHSGQSRTTTNTLCAFSVILPLNQSNWYLERQSTFAEMFLDAITRFKAASLVESVEDLVCRCTREFLSVFLLFGALERWPLVMGRDLTQLRIQHSHLWELNKMPNSDFLARCITACLVCRGRCTILGGTPTEMAHPYLRLQAIKRSELHQFLDKASAAHWSAALLDIDRRSVSFTGLYHGKHRAQKMRSQQHQIGQIFRDAVQAGMEVPAQILREMDQSDADGGGRSVADILETQTVQAEPSVKDFLDLVHLMPLNRPARISFVDHFHLRLDNRAKALIAYVRDLSIPSPNDKRSALSSKWHLITVRRNLNLLADTSFGIVLARAESLQPEFAEFIAQQTTNAGRHIRQ